MRVNINQYVKVKLTARGREILDAAEQEERAILEAAKPYVPTLDPNARHYPQPDADGYTNWTFWELMQIFGPHLCNGCPIPFEDNRIDFGEGPPINVYQVVYEFGFGGEVIHTFVQLDNAEKALTQFPGVKGVMRTFTTKDGL